MMIPMAGFPLNWSNSWEMEILMRCRTKLTKSRTISPKFQQNIKPIFLPRESKMTKKPSRPHFRTNYTEKIVKTLIILLRSFKNTRIKFKNNLKRKILTQKTMIDFHYIMHKFVVFVWIWNSLKFLKFHFLKKKIQFLL